MRVLLTRPLEESRKLDAQLESVGIDSLIWPLTRIVPLTHEIKLPYKIDAVLFTSGNGARALAALTRRRNFPALCVGHATAEVARECGFRDCFSADGDSHALAALARRSGLRDFLFPRGRDTSGDLKRWLEESGHCVTELILYEARETGAPPAPVEAAFGRGEIDLVTVWSRRNGAILAAYLHRSDANLANTDLLAISQQAAEPLAGMGFRQVLIADSPDLSAMMRAIKGRFTESRSEIQQ